ncbi:MAG: hypothetical protein IPG85_08430 [Bacteroidetes bacterium]|nr:hypothetical protein [Bacteroidota bacterium]
MALAVGNGTITINVIGGNPLPNYTYVLTPVLKQTPMACLQAWEQELIQ